LLLFLFGYLLGEGGERLGDGRRGERRGEGSAFLLPLWGSVLRLRGESLGEEAEVGLRLEEGEEGCGEEDEEGVELSLGTTTEILGTESREEDEEEGWLERSSEEPLPFAVGERGEEVGGGGGASASSSSRGALPLRLRSIPNFKLSSSNFRVAGFFNPPPPADSLSFCAAFCVCASSFCKHIEHKISFYKYKKQRGER
jgi:hypothetical protein